MLLDGKIALVTGAASPRGLGLATARMFADHGATVFILDLDLGQSVTAAESLGDRHQGLACDVTDKEACEAAADAVIEAAGRIDILVNNAGISQPLKTLDIAPDNYDAVLDVSLRGALYMSQAVIPAMREQRSGSIVNMSSVSAQRGGGIFGGPHYSAAKAGMLGLTKAMAREFAGDGIRVNAVCPGMIDTDIIATMGDQQRAEIIRAVPMGRIGRAEDVAGCCLFLASDLSAYVTGSEVDVNGGSHIH